MQLAGGLKTSFFVGERLVGFVLDSVVVIHSSHLIMLG